jgi:catecholate siderophore receptor
MSMGGELTNGWSLVADNGGAGSAATRRDQRTSSSWRAFKSALLLGAASFVADAAGAQQAPEPVPLPPLNVEATAKKKSAAKKGAAKKAAPATQVAPAPQPPPAQAAQQADPLPGQAAPVAPGAYNAQFSTSPKVTGPLLNTPQTVTVVPTAIIQERKSTNLIETLKNTPGITIDAGENAFGSGGLQFNIRGFNSVGNVFIDGTRDNGVYARDTFNVEQVEVFKGPAADNGRGSAGGYVNIVTKTPTLEDFVEAEVGFGFDEYDSETRRRVAFDVNQNSGTVSARLNAFVQDGGIAGRDVAEANAWGAAPSLAFGLRTDTRAIFSYEHVERNDVPDSGVAINRPQGQFGVGVDGGPRGYIANLPRDFFFGRPSDYDDVMADSFIARFEHDLSDSVTITNQTRWSQLDRQVAYHVPSNTLVGGIPGNQNYFDRENETLTNQTNLAARFYTGQFRHTLSTGVEFSREEGAALRFATGNPIATQRSSVEINTAAAYVYDTVELDRHWQVVGGIRVENYDVDISGQGVPGVPAGRPYSDSEMTVGGKVGVVYKPIRDASVYAAYGISHLPQGSLLSNPDISRTDNSFPGFVAGADAVEFHNYEAGVKYDFFGGKLSTTAALFNTIKQNVAYGAANAASGIVYGEQEVRGIELGIAGELTKYWKVYGGVMLMESERHHGPHVDAVLSGDYGTATGNNASAPNYRAVTTTDGDELSFTPNVSATLWTTYDVTDDLTVGGGVQYVGESWIGRTDDALRVIPNGKYGKLPDYFLVNLYASYDVTENVELSLNVDNVFDELYLTTANWGGGWGYLGAPRTYWLNASVDF